jgi:hypothetical protein
LNPATFVRRRVAGTYDVDPWGLDTDLVELVSPLADVRWAIEVDGAHHVPAEGPALVVFNRRWGLSEPVVVARGLRRAAGRSLRLAGAADMAPVGPLLRRFGATIAAPAEIGSLLRAGEVVGEALGRAPGWGRHAAGLRPEPVELALAHAAPIIPGAVVGHELGRRWRVVLAPPVAPAADSRGPRLLAELVDQVRVTIQGLLDGTPVTRL